MEFCCETFESYYLIRNTAAPKIRIVKFISDYLTNNIGAYIRKHGREIKINKKRNDFSFLISSKPYESFSMINNPLIIINFCPFCGTNLHKFYDKDEYANEIEGESFKL